jgi:DNA repair exonuclease SbcCD nuclease subunit
MTYPIQTIDIGIDMIRKIYHISDVHIRNLKRHKEYKTVFNRTAEEIKKQLTANDIIFLGGDIVHAKTDMTPELIQEVHDFLKLFSDIAPTIMIAGNHDMNLNNKSRLDALTPIVNALNHKNLIYLRKSGLYHIANKLFIVLAVDDKPANYIEILNEAANITQYDKIILHHGAVSSATTDIGFVIENDHMPLDLFNICNASAVLLGDIHKPNQTLQEYEVEEMYVDEMELQTYLNNGWTL